MEAADATAGDALRGIARVLQQAAFGKEVDSYAVADAVVLLMLLAAVAKDELDDWQAVCERIRRRKGGTG